MNLSAKKIIIDTDIGDDVDDALAVALALNSPEVELLGVTTVYKNTRMRAGLAKRLLEVYGREDIPVHQGIGMPYINKVDLNEEPNQYEAVGDDRFTEQGNAVDFIIETVMKTDDVTLIPVGPLTNIAAALEKEPAIAKRARVVLMGGIISNPYAENNILCDPEAAKIVFESGIPIVMTGLDVTLKYGLTMEHVALVNSSDKKEHKFLSKLIDLWQTKFMAIVFKMWNIPFERVAPALHDPMAVAFVINPSFFTTRKCHIKIETKGEFTRGVTVDSRNVFTGQATGFNADVCVDVDERFVEFFVNRVLK